MTLNAHALVIGVSQRIARGIAAARPAATQPPRKDPIMSTTHDLSYGNCGRVAAERSSGDGGTLDGVGRSASVVAEASVGVR
jgi:hypothetical protein